MKRRGTARLAPAPAPGLYSIADAPAALTPPLQSDVEQRLLARIRVVQGWLADFARALGKSRPPRLKTRLSGGDLHHAPIENILLVPAPHLLVLSDEHLRVGVAHEMGHFARRWPSLLAWSFSRRMDEEAHADRAAVALTGTSVAEWSASMCAIAAIELGEFEVASDPGFIARSTVLQRWCDARDRQRRALQIQHREPQT